MESISIFEIIKIGVGPSSSHTMGPWEAALLFINDLTNEKLLYKIKSINVYLYGSLAKTGQGHGTDYAIFMGLSGMDYKIESTEKLEEEYKIILSQNKIKISKDIFIPFNKENIMFENSITLNYHPNGMKFSAILDDNKVIEKTYFSIGGGFVIESNSINKENKKRCPSNFQCHNGETILSYCKKLNISVAELVMLSEKTWLSKPEIKFKSLDLWNEMINSIWRGCNKSGYLPGILHVKRRAGEIFNKLNNKKFENLEDWIISLKEENKNFIEINKWISCFALAVNEENASFGRIVTSPTNGASGVIPSVLMYAYCFLDNIDDDKIVDFLLVAGEIGSLFKKSATISAAMGGCQAEIGVSSAMAAAGLTQIQGGSAEQVLMAAEISMEHHLGLTCDPVAGLVQIPCIERNTMGAIKAITASNIALESNPKDAKVSLDNVIKTMWQTALDMNTKYKETSEAGLATNISVNLSEC